AAVGAYAVGGEVTDLVILLAIGLIGFGMRRYGLPVLPAIIGVILGPAAEQQLRRALQISDGSATGLVNTPFSVTVYAVVTLLLAWPLLRKAVRRGRGGERRGGGRRGGGRRFRWFPVRRIRGLRIRPAGTTAERGGILTSSEDPGVRGPGAPGGEGPPPGAWWSEEVGEDHQVLGVVLHGVVVVARAGDEPDLRVRGVGVHPLVGEVVLVEGLGTVHHEGGRASVGARHLELVALLQFTEPREHGRGRLGVHVPGDDRRAELARGHALGEPADQVGVVGRGRLEPAVLADGQVGEGRVGLDAGDAQPGRCRPRQVLVGRRARGRSGGCGRSGGGGRDGGRGVRHVRVVGGT